MSFKTFDLSQDVASVVSPINEVVSVSSSIYAFDQNVKKYSNIASASAGADLGGYFQTVFDASPTSSFSSALMDLTYGYSTGSSYNAPVTATSSQNEKVKVYRQMASALLGNPDSLFVVNNAPISEAFFVMLKRNIQKDEVKKGATAVTVNGTSNKYSISDSGAAVNFKQTVGGDYAPLKSGSQEFGQIWYNAGVIVLSPSASWSANTVWSGSKSLQNSQYSGSINNLVDGLRLRMDRLDVHNQTNLYSTIYFCRASNAEFNYSSNPTFVDDNKRIRVTSGSNILQTRTYVTTIGLYDANDNLLAVAKLNKPITKSPDSESIFRVRLDY